MVRIIVVVLFFFFISCTKKIGAVKKDPANESTVKACQISSVVSFSSTILPIIQNNCNTCHSSPGSGGISLDSYSSIKQLAQSGEMMPVVSNTDANSTMMPPPPQRHLDSCEIKTLAQWISQSCPDN